MERTEGSGDLSARPGRLDQLAAWAFSAYLLIAYLLIHLRVPPAVPGRPSKFNNSGSKQ